MIRGRGRGPRGKEAHGVSLTPLSQNIGTVPDLGVLPDSRRTLTCGYGLRCTDWTSRTDLRIRRSSLRPEGTRVVAWLRTGDGPLSVRARPSSLKRDCDRRATSTGEKRLVNVHAKSRLTPEPLRALRSETKGQAGACPDQTRAIPCTVRVALLRAGLRRVDSNDDSNSSDQRLPAATGDNA